MRLSLVILLVGVCAQAAPGRTLFERVGGKPAVAALVDELLARAVADKRIKGRFLDADVAHLKPLLVEFVCSAAGGPCKYEGRDMHAAHAGMQLAGEEVDALLEDVSTAMKKLGVLPPEQEELLNLLKPLKAQLVQAPPPEALKVDVDLVDKAKQLALMLQNVGKHKPGDLVELAVVARLRGQRSYADELFSAAELEMKPDSLAVLAPLFRAGGPPRSTARPKAAEDTPQPKGAVGSSDDDDTPAKAKSGSLSGTLTLDGKPQAGVVMLTPASGKKRPTPKARVIELRGRELAPHITVVPVGSTVTFPNFDSAYHNLFSLSPAKAFDLGMYKRGEAREVTFDKEGVVRIACNLHDHTPAYLLVVAAPYYAVTDGKIHLTKIAPGRYKVRAWTEQSLDPVVQQIEIRPGENAIALDAKSGARPESTNKFGEPLSPRAQ